MQSVDSRKQIIVAEDHDQTRELIATRLELAGYQAIEARNGLEALEQVRTTSPVALVLDLLMPELDGFEVMRELQSREARLPVLVVSARRTVDDVRKAIGLGADAFLTKPFDDKLLLERVERLVNPPRLPGNFFII